LDPAAGVNSGSPFCSAHELNSLLGATAPSNEQPAPGREGPAPPDISTPVSGLAPAGRTLGGKAKGVEKNDEPEWIVGTFSTLLDLIEGAVDEATALIVKEELGEEGQGNWRRYREVCLGRY
jgi:hypothetical protein